MPFVTLPLLYILGERGLILWVVAAAGSMLSIRFLSDWKREYKELWLDRDNAE
jgi:hypothetical protein